jgi:hypothetical protein
MLIAKCLTLEKNGVFGLKVRRGGKGKDKMRLRETGVSFMETIILTCGFTKRFMIMFSLPISLVD